MYLDKLKYAVFEVFKEMIDNGELPKIEGIEPWEDSMGSLAFLYDDGEDGRSFYINDTGFENTFPDDVEDVYCGIEIVDPDKYSNELEIQERFKFPSEYEVKELLKEVYMKFYNAKRKDESFAEIAKKISECLGE